jgi:lambda family phage portal protein
VSWLDESYWSERASVGLARPKARRPTSPARKAGVRLTTVDRLIGWLSPERGMRRAAARVAFSATRAYYDGATKGRRGAGLRRKQADPNVITRAQLWNLREHCRDLIRNNAHARRAVESIVANVVGTGIRTHLLRNNAQDAGLRALQRAHLETTACDSDGKHNLYGLQSLAFDSVVAAGEALVRRRWRRPGDGLAVPVQFQVMEPDYLDDARDGPTVGGGVIHQGVEYDATGRIRQYWLLTEHPGGRFKIGTSRPVPARDVIHAFRIDRPGQARGIPWGAPVVLAHADFGDYEDAQRVRQKIAACWAAFITEEFEGPGLANSTREEDDDFIDSFEPGMIERLLPGQTVSFATPPGVDGYRDFSDITLHKIAVGWGISYETLTSDLRGVNFSSGKMGRLEMQRNVDRWQHLLAIPQIVEPMTRWWLEAVALTGVDVEGVSARHVAAKHEMIDPPRELRSERDAIRAGQRTLTEALLARGRDPEEHFREYAADMALLDRLGVVIESDVRQRTSQGQPVDDGDGGAGFNRLHEELEDLLTLLTPERRNGT